MTTNKSVGQYLWITAVLFMTYLLLGSFIIERNMSYILYLLILYGTIVLDKIKK